VVRRRSNNAFKALPRWVTYFEPSDWPGESDVYRWRNWFTAVHDYCDAERLIDSDFGLWLEVISGAQTRVYEINAQNAAARADKQRAAIKEHPLFGKEVEI
jgi:hypothetical protein